MLPSNTLQRIGTCLLAAQALLASPIAWAEKPAVELRYGQDGGHYESAGIGLRLGALWSRDMESWKATLHPEIELNRFRHTGSAGGPDTVNQLGGIGLLRIMRGDSRIRPYGELGLGLALLSRDSLGTKEFSTRYQFSEHIGLGVEFNGTWVVGWRFSHYSNAGVKLPNDGISLNQLVVGVNF